MSVVVDYSRSIQKVSPGLFIGPLSPAEDEAYLQKYGVTHRVSCLSEPPRDVSCIRETFHVPVKDDNNDSLDKYFEATTVFIRNAIEQEHGQVLVHCSSGVSRSAAVVLAYLIIHKQLPLTKALKAVSRVRPVVLPSASFFEALQGLDRQLQEKREPQVLHEFATDTDYKALQVRAATLKPLQVCYALLERHGGDAATVISKVLDGSDGDAALADDAASDDDSLLNEVAHDDSLPEQPTHNVFVYGTLMRGYWNYDRLMQGATFIGRYRTVNKYALFVDRVPFLNPLYEETHVLGELFEVKHEDMPALDVLEGHPDFYYRELIPIVADDRGAGNSNDEAEGDGGHQKEPVRAWTYFNKFAIDKPRMDTHPSMSESSLFQAAFVPTGDFRDAVPPADTTSNKAE